MEEDIKQEHPDPSDDPLHPSDGESKIHVVVEGGSVEREEKIEVYEAPMDDRHPFVLDITAGAQETEKALGTPQVPQSTLKDINRNHIFVFNSDIGDYEEIQHFFDDSNNAAKQQQSLDSLIQKINAEKRRKYPTESKGMRDEILQYVRGGINQAALGAAEAHLTGDKTTPLGFTLSNESKSDKPARTYKIKVINKNTIEVQEERPWFSATYQSSSGSAIMVVANNAANAEKNKEKRIFCLKTITRFVYNKRGKIEQKIISSTVTSTLKAENLLKEFINALYEKSRRVTTQDVVSFLPSIFTAGLFLMLGFTVFAASVNFGLAVSGKFLMTGVLGTPFIVFILAGLAITFIALIIQSLKSSTESTSIYQAITSAIAGKKILKKLAENSPDEETKKILISALKIHVEHVKKLLLYPWRKAIASYYSARETRNGTEYKKIDDPHHINVAVNVDLRFLSTINLDDLSVQKLDDLQKIFTIVENITIDPSFRPLYSLGWRIFWFITSALFLIGCVTTLVFIFTSGVTLPTFSLLGMSGMIWSMLLATIGGVGSLFFAKRTLNKISGAGAYATLTAVCGAATTIFATLLVFLILGTNVGLSLPVAIAATSSAAFLFLVNLIFAVINAKRTPAERAKKLHFLTANIEAEKAEDVDAEDAKAEHAEQVPSIPAYPRWKKIGAPIFLITVFPAGVVVPAFFILIGSWPSYLLFLPITLGFACFALSDWVINRVSDSPFATSAAISVIGLVTIAVIWPSVAVVLGADLGLHMAFLGITLTLIATTIMSGFFLSKNEEGDIQRVGQDGERLLRALKVVLIAGFSLLAFLSMAMILQLNNLGPFSGMLNFTFGIADALSNGNTEMAMQWMGAFGIAVFAISGFIVSELIKSVLQKTPAQNASPEGTENRLKKITAVSRTLFKFIFTMGLMIFLIATMSSTFGAGTTTSMLPVFFIISTFAWIFGGNTDLPFPWFNKYFGINPLIEKNSVLSRPLRELYVAGIIFFLSLILFAALHSLNNTSLAVLGISLGATLSFRVFNMIWQDKMHPEVLAQVYLEEEMQKDNVEKEDVPLTDLPDKREEDVPFTNLSGDEKGDRPAQPSSSTTRPRKPEKIEGDNHSLHKRLNPHARPKITGSSGNLAEDSVFGERGDLTTPLLGDVDPEDPTPQAPTRENMEGNEPTGQLVQ